MATKFVIRVVELAGKYDSKHDGEYIMSYESDVYEKGLGRLTTTPHVESALKFDTVHEALKFYTQQSVSVPMRDDGNPNRPLTAFTVEIASVGTHDITQ